VWHVHEHTHDPSIATWVSGQWGSKQTHASYDLVAACAGCPTGCPRGPLLQEVARPVLVVCVEKFSDKIGNVRPSRMIFGDGAAAMLIGVAGPGEEPTSNTCRPTPADRPPVNSIIWPNPSFDNNIRSTGRR